MQESKLGDFEFQSIKLLAFRRAVVAAAAATTAVRSSSSPLTIYLSFLSHPFLFFSLSSLRPPSFFPRILFAAEIHTDVSPTPLAYPTLVVLQLPLPSPSPFPLPLPTLLPRLLLRHPRICTYIHTRVRSLAYTRSTQRAVTPLPSITDRPSGQMVEEERGDQTS